MNTTHQRTPGRAVTLTLAVLWLLATAVPVSAKVPPFTVSVEPDPPVAGETATITVEFDDWGFPAQELTDLVELNRATPTGTRIIPVTLVPVDETRYAAEVVISEAGVWVLDTFPGSLGAPPFGYPDDVTIEVVERRVTCGMVPSALIAGVIALGVAGFRLRRSTPDRT